MIFKALYEFIAPKESSLLSKLTPFQEMMLTLVKLRLNPSMQDLAHRFGIHCSTVSRIFLKWLIMPDAKLKTITIVARACVDIADSVGMYQARLHVPAFTKGKNQLTALEVEETQSIANVRIHVERVIGMVRQKYTIFKAHYQYIM